MIEILTSGRYETCDYNSQHNNRAWYMQKYEQIDPLDKTRFRLANVASSNHVSGRKREDGINAIWLPA